MAGLGEFQRLDSGQGSPGDARESDSAGLSARTAADVTAGMTAPAETRRSAAHAEDQRRARLARTIEGEIIPRLKLAHGLSQPCQWDAPSSGGRITADDVFAFAKLVLRTDVGTGLAHIEVMRTQEASLDAVFLDLLAPTAKLLGDLWLADECSFIDVTIGLARLHQIVRELSPEFEPDLTEEAHPARRALVLPAPGEQHTFGCFLVEHYFRRAGWEVAAPPSNGSGTGLTQALRGDWYSLVGFSVSCVELLDGLQATIRSLRHVSLNPNLIVMVGGPAFQENPKLVSQVGADAVANDARQAVLAADGLLASTKTASAERPRTKANWKRNGAPGLTRYGSPV